jgi:L-lactate permease
MNPTICTYSFLLTMMAALSASAFYYFIAAKVKSVGDRVGRMITPMSIKALAARYEILAKERDWPRWPVILMWISFCLFAAFAVIDATRCLNH